MTQIEHALQCAYFAKQFNYDGDIIIAALLHDIGHIIPYEKKEKMDSWGICTHETKGSIFLKEHGLNDRICSIINNHVKAKRYLCTIDKLYRDKLSEASQNTMKYQGGLMSDDELNEFKKDKYFEDSIKLRHLDDMGKMLSSIDYGHIEDYRELLSNTIQK